MSQDADPWALQDVIGKKKSRTPGMYFGGREQRKSGIWARKSLLSKKGCRTGFCWVYSDLKTLGANRKAMMFIANADPLSSAFILFYFP